MTEAVVGADCETRVDDRVDAGDDALGRNRRRRPTRGQLVAGAVEEGGEAPHRRRPLRQCLGAGDVNLDDQGPSEIWLGVEEVEQGPQTGAEPIRPSRLASGGVADPRLDSLHPDVVSLQVAVVLVGEVVVERLPVETGAVQHGADRGALVALGTDRFEHSVQDPLPL